MKYRGSCHCQRIAYEVEGEIDALMQCNCSICSRRGYLLWFVSRDQVQLSTPVEDMSSYQFGKQRIRHNFCPRCGCAPLGFGADEQGNEMVAINARCLEGVDLEAVTINHFDGKAI